MFCKICGGAIDPDVESINGTHAGMDYCVVILNARVNHEQVRAEAAERRVAELEARLAERDAEIAALTNYPNSEYGHVNY